MKPEYEEKFRALRTTLVGTDPEVRKQIKLDPEDEWLLDAFKWRIRQDRRVWCSIRMSNFCLPNHTHLEVDHINRDPWDNRSCNLRYATREENMANTGPISGRFKGVSYYSRTKRWKSQFQAGAHYHAGYHDTEVDAAIDYDQFAIRYGIPGFQYLNFPELHGLAPNQAPDGMIRLDDELAWIWNAFPWCAPIHRVWTTRISLHRCVRLCDDDLDIDHINHDPVDNRKKNLRACTRSQNVRNTRRRCSNTSGFIGVHPCDGKWAVKASYQDWGQIRIGLFDTPEKAAMARDDFVMKIDPVHYVLNFPERYHEGKRVST